MNKHTYQLDKADDFDAICAGVRRFVVLRSDAPPYFSVGDLLYIRHRERSTSTTITTLQELPGGFVVYGIAGVWTHADAGLEEDMVSQLEEACALLRLHSHGPYEENERRSDALDIRNKAALLHLFHGGYRART